MYKSSTPSHFDHYQSVKANLQRQTAALLAERNQLQSRYAANQPPRQKIRQLFSQQANITPLALQKKIDSSKTQQVVNKLKQIIKLCKQEGSLSNQEMREVIKVQNQVLNYLHRTSTQSQPKLVNPQQEQFVSNSLNTRLSQNQYLYHQNQQEPPKFRSFPTQVQQKILQQQNESQSKIDSPQVIKSKRDINQNAAAIIPQTWGKQQRINFMSQDTIQIIAAIQRKALTQIIHLQQERDTFRKQRDSLLIQLQKVKGQAASNQQTVIQRVSQEQHKISRIKGLEIERLVSENQLLKASITQSELIRKQNKMLRDENQVLIQRIEQLQSGFRQVRKTDYRQTYPEYQQPRTGLAFGQYDSQIAVYENQLRRATVVINELRSRLANIPGLEELHEQGERIRRQTTQLLQLKARGSAPTHESSLIRQLQQRLQEQERGKVLFLQQLKSFKQKYSEIELQNRMLKKSKVSFDQIPKMASTTNTREISPSRGIMKKRNIYFSDYEQSLKEMKKILY